MTTELERRLAALPAAAPGLTLPSGRLVRPEDGGPPVLWLSDDVAPHGLWAAVAAAFASTGLWPLLVEDLEREPGRPWQAGELSPSRGWTPGATEAADVLARGWAGTWPDPGEDDPEYLEVFEPFAGWPGPAPAGTYRQDPEALAAAVADRLAAGRRLCLVAVSRGADALDEVGWTGHANYDVAPGETSAVLRDWEVRFGARLVAAGFDTVELSVAAPPQDEREALHVAAEHLAFCPDNVHQGPGSIRGYAAELAGQDHWSFWWD